MINRIFQIFDKAIHKYSTNEFKDQIILAKKRYFELTGKAHEEDEDYESRMAMFNEWYIFNYITDNETRPLIKKFLEENQLLADEIAYPLLNINYSLFELRNTNPSSRSFCYDLLHKRKVSLDLNHYEMGLLKYDIFIGREVDFNGTSSFFPAVSVLPKDIKKILLKQCEKLSKHHNPYLECEFLLRLESYKSKLKNYGHLDTKKIFVFED